MRPDFERVDLDVILENVKSDFELLIEERNCIIESNRMPILEAIPIQMSQLFGNMISNSLKFIAKDVQPKISIFAEVLSDEALRHYEGLLLHKTFYKISFQDNGIGFDQAHAQQIFEIFQRLHAKSEFEGTGIGLAMCKKIAENHGGLMEAISKPGEGATFILIIPAVQ